MKRYGKRYLSWGRFEREFEPIFQGDHCSWGGYAIENFRQRWDAECLPALEENRLWSACIYDDSWCICPGNHPVNREAVILTRKPIIPEVEDLYVPY